MTNTENTPSTGLAKLALIAACFFWAVSFIATKTALNHIPPLTVVMLRMVVSALCFGLWLIIRQRKLSFMGWGWLGYLVVMSLFGTGSHYSIQTIGLQFTSASNASLYAVTGPISITIIAAIFLKEKVSALKLLGIVCAITGVIMVMGFETVLAFELKGHLLGDLLVFSSIFMWGIFTVLSKKMTARMNHLEMTAIVTFIGAFYMIPLGGFEMKGLGFSLFSIPLEAWGAVVFLGVLCSFLSVMFYMYALSRMESQKVGVYLYTIPPMTYVIAALILHEAITLNLIFGSLVVFGGVYLTQKG